jgi:hypothetical protein
MKAQSSEKSRDKLTTNDLVLTSRLKQGPIHHREKIQEIGNASYVGNPCKGRNFS